MVFLFINIISEFFVAHTSKFNNNPDTICFELSLNNRSSLLLKYRVQCFLSTFYRDSCRMQKDKVSVI